MVRRLSLLEVEQLKQKFPWVNTDSLKGATFGRADEGTFSLGVEYIENEVVDIIREGNKITDVRLKNGDVIACGTLVNCAGTRGAKVARMAGLEIPVEPRRRSLFVFACRTALEGNVPLTIDPTGVFFRPEGQFYLGGTYPKVDPEVDPEDFDVLHEEFDEEVWPILAERVPAFEAIKVVNSWAGHYDYCVLDHNAIVGPHNEVDNFLFCNGFSGHGLQQAPAIGRGLGELITYGGQVLVDALLVNGVERAFCVPGESYLAVLDALHDVKEDIDLIVCRQEGGAAYMAEAYGKLTGKSGICFVTRGPGATNASVGIHTGFQDSTPMILFIGQVARDQMDREAFQEIDYRRMFGEMAKWIVQVDDAKRLPELINQAFYRAMNGRPGPVVIALPEDMLTDIVDVADALSCKTY
ncbi:hypothetical protein FQR65_LT20241 [Abscondita terminalis]|nr:hypothetical protein FQR65_LT20241 [Abscondita terminalis]